jgi:hypothetical protein
VWEVFLAEVASISVPIFALTTFYSFSSSSDSSVPGKLLPLQRVFPAVLHWHVALAGAILQPGLLLVEASGAFPHPFDSPSLRTRHLDRRRRHHHQHEARQQ